MRDSVRTGRNFSPARKVLSITAPSSARLSLVRTNAPPLPGFTCWNSTILKTVPSTSMWVPFLNWLVLIMRAGRLAALGWAEAEQPAQVSLELGGSVVELTPGDADDAPAGGLEATVRARSRSNESVVSWTVRPSSSTMRRSAGQTQSTSIPSMRRLVIGRGRPALRRKAWKRSSSSLRMTVRPSRASSTTALRIGIPGLRGYRGIRSPSQRRSVRWSCSACLTALRSSWR